MDRDAASVLTPFLQRDGVVVLDGGLATELERRGADLRDPLWSAKCLLEQPELVEAVHFDYFQAGADIGVAASYQASFEGFAKRGLSRQQTADLLHQSVRLTQAARETFWREADRQTIVRPLVAASVGPYGAFLADGSEFRGDYGLTVQQLRDWHRPRLAVLASSGADLLACETIPSLAEVEALVSLLEEFPETPAWVSCSCRDDSHLSHGEPFVEAVRLANACANVIAVGVNCTAPRWIDGLLAAAREVAKKPLLVYPNRGERWDAAARAWQSSPGPLEWSAAARRWRAAGAQLIGGCCRTTPETIRAIRAALIPGSGRAIS
jgi:homocysteine S-methyltransferase